MLIYESLINLRFVVCALEWMLRFNGTDCVDLNCSRFVQYWNESNCRVQLNEWKHTNDHTTIGTFRAYKCVFYVKVAFELFSVHWSTIVVWNNFEFVLFSLTLERERGREFFSFTFLLIWNQSFTQTRKQTPWYSIYLLASKFIIVAFFIIWFHH